MRPSFFKEKTETQFPFVFSSVEQSDCDTFNFDCEQYNEYPNEVLHEIERMKAKNRLSSASSKDSGHNSGSIDRSTVNSSNSSSSNFSQNSIEKDKPTGNQKKKILEGLTEDEKSVMGLNSYTYSPQSEFEYIKEKLHCGKDGYCFDNNQTRVRIDPIYELIPEREECE